jgi:transcriptional antiterminator RfaH
VRDEPAHLSTGDVDAIMAAHRRTGDVVADSSVEIADRSTDSSPESASWYALRSKPKQEVRADANLRAWGVETLLPMIRSLRVDGSREALFPGYLFARFHAPTMTHKIRNTRGVTQLVGISHAPTAIDDQIIAMLRERIGADGCVALDTDLRAGDVVRVTAGPFRDFIGVFESSTTAAQRVTLLLAAVESPIRLSIDCAMVERFTARTSLVPAASADRV